MRAYDDVGKKVRVVWRRRRRPQKNVKVGSINNSWMRGRRVSTREHLYAARSTPAAAAIASGKLSSETNYVIILSHRFRYQQFGRFWKEMFFNFDLSIECYLILISFYLIFFDNLLLIFFKIKSKIWKNSKHFSKNYLLL